MYNNDTVKKIIKKGAYIDVAKNEKIDRNSMNEVIELLKKITPEQKTYIAGVIDGMAAERKLADSKPA